MIITAPMLILMMSEETRTSMYCDLEAWEKILCNKNKDLVDDTAVLLRCCEIINERKPASCQTTMEDM